MDVSRPRSLLREAFSSTASRSSTMAVSRSAVAPGSTSSPVPRRRGVTSGSPALPKASNRCGWHHRLVSTRRDGRKSCSALYHR